MPIATSTGKYPLREKNLTGFPWIHAVHSKKHDQNYLDLLQKRSTSLYFCQYKSGS